MIGGLDAPWIRPGEPFDFERAALEVWHRELDAAIADLIAAPMTLLDTVAHPDGVEPQYLAAIVTRLLVVSALDGSPDLDHARRWYADIDVIAARSREKGRPPRFEEPDGEWHRDERALAFAFLVALAVERAARRGGPAE